MYEVGKTESLVCSDETRHSNPARDSSSLRTGLCFVPGLQGLPGRVLDDSRENAGTPQATSVRSKGGN